MGLMHMHYPQSRTHQYLQRQESGDKRTGNYYYLLHSAFIPANLITRKPRNLICGFCSSFALRFTHCVAEGEQPSLSSALSLRSTIRACSTPDQYPLVLRTLAKKVLISS
jgi:hypothetical protein